MARPPRTSRTEAAQVAIELIDQDGLDALSMAAVARRLGVKAPSLYNHFDDRSDLVRTIGRELLRAGEFVESSPHADWRGLLEDQAVQVRRAIAAHPNAAPLLLEVSPRFVVPTIYEQWIALLDAHGVPSDAWLVIIEGLESMTYGAALALAARKRLGLRRFPEPADALPHLAAVADQASTPAFDEESVFRAGVRALLAGVVSVGGSGPSDAN